MGIVRISDNVYSVGVLDPSLRIFDVVMQTKYGTSYNAYLVSDNDQVILVDTVSEDYFDEYIYNVQCLTEISEIEYIIMNHTELDHSGSLKNLLELNPNITVVCTAAAQKYLRQIINKDFKCKVVKDNETWQVNSLKFDFISAPLLHWPDSMMTYIESDEVLFTCDFLGSHFCEPTMLEDSMHNRDKYLSEFKNYYDGIFSPFRKFVVKGLQKIKNLKIEYLCPSHGPVLSESIEDRISDYFNWSSESVESNKKIVIVYASAHGCTAEIAKVIFDEVNEMKDYSVEIYNAVDDDINVIKRSVNEADVLFVGSCTINKNAPKIIWEILSSIDAINSRGKSCGIFGSYGWSGEALEIISSMMSKLGYKLPDDNFVKVNFKMADEDVELIKNYTSKVLQTLK